MAASHGVSLLWKYRQCCWSRGSLSPTPTTLILELRAQQLLTLPLLQTQQGWKY